MFTDIVGYTTLAQQNEASALRLLKKHNRLIRPVISHYRGREVKNMGDAFLVEFDSALDATECSIAIQKALRTPATSPKDKLRVRIGIHVGDVIHTRNDVLGDAVNIASRIEPLAEGGGICISEQVYDQVRNKISYPMVKLESRNLKNVTFPIDVYRVQLPWQPQREQQKKANDLMTSSATTTVKSVERETIGRFFLNLTLRNHITVVKMKNDPEIPVALAKFSQSVSYGAGETLNFVSAVETMSIAVDSKNLERLLATVPRKNLLEIYPKQAMIIVSVPDETLFMPGFVSIISGELAKNKVNILEYFTSTPQQIVIVDEKDALKSYNLLQGLTTEEPLTT